VSDVEPVEVGDGLNNLLDDGSDFVFWQEPPGQVPAFDVLVEGDAFDVLHDEVEALLSVNGLVELDDVRVVDTTHDLDLSGDRTLSALRRQHLLLVVDLHGASIIRFLVESGVNHCIGSFAELLADHEVV